MDPVKIMIDGQEITTTKGTVIQAAADVGIDIPHYCYHAQLSIAGNCRMCMVEIEKMPKLQTACTTPVAEGMVVSTESDKVKQARKSMLELLLANHPLDCPVCDAGGECELQDMTFKYGAAESKFMDLKNHREEQQWSPVVFFDRPRCILCYRCIRACGEGMDVWALGIHNRGSSAIIAPCVQAPPQPRLTRLRQEGTSGRDASHCCVSSVLPLSITRMASAGVPLASRLSTQCRVYASWLSTGMTTV